jgi:hypothetical protein
MTDQPKTRRRFPRFSLRTLLLLPVLFAAAWWWITWPERTARRFVELLSAGDFESARKMCDESQPIELIWMLARMPEFTFAAPVVHDQSWGERLAGRRQFQIPWSFESNRGNLKGLVASRGRIRLRPASGAGVLKAYQLRNVSADMIAYELSELFTGNPDCKFVADARLNRVVARLPEPLDSHAQAWIAVMDSEPKRSLSRVILSAEAVEKLKAQMREFRESKSRSE